LRRLSVFAAGFTLESGVAVSAGTDIDTAQAMEGVTNLVAKSLISADVSGTDVQYRLLDTTRAYALQKLNESGEFEALVRRHAEHHRDLFARAKPEWRKRPSADMLADYRGKIDDVRSALSWSFSAGGDVSVGVSLTIAAVPLWTHLSLLAECQQWVSKALAEMADVDRGSSAELALQEAVAISAMYTSGNSAEVENTIERGLSIAARLGDYQYQLHLLAGLNLFLTRLEQYRSALTAAQRFNAVAKASGGVRERVASAWMLGATYHLLGQQASARDHYEQGFGLAISSGITEAHYFGYDHQVRALIGRARVWFLRGHLEQSAEFARQAVSVATSQAHPVTLCITLSYTAPVLLWLGDLSQAEDLVERLLKEASRHSLTPYMAGGLALRGELMLANGELESAISTLRGALTSLDAERQYIFSSSAARALAECLMRRDQPEEALHVVDGLLASATTVDSFMLPELLRTRAETHLAVASRDTAAAESGFVQAITAAREQGSLTWELRAAIGLAHLRVEQGDFSAALKLLRDVRRAFGSEARSGDLRAADKLLDALSSYD